MRTRLSSVSVDVMDGQRSSLGSVFHRTVLTFCAELDLTMSCLSRNHIGKEQVPADVLRWRGASVLQTAFW